MAAVEGIRERKRIERQWHETSAILGTLTRTFLETGDWSGASHQRLKGSETVGLMAAPNRPRGYTGQEVRSLEILSQAAGVPFDNYRQNLKRWQLEEQRAHLESEYRQSWSQPRLQQHTHGLSSRNHFDFASVGEQLKLITHQS
jgi:hypothetical protein